MKHILLIATGGTIASIDSGSGLTPQLGSEDLMTLVPELKQICSCDAVQLMNLDSTNISSEHWLEMARCVRERYDDYDGFVLTHGTDTMAYTAAALSYLIQNNRKPVVITGAQKSISLRDTDARENLVDAFCYAADDGACGVHVVFDHQVIIGTRARKMRTKSYHAFDSVDYPPTAIFRNHRLVYYIREEIAGEDESLLLDAFGEAQAAELAGYDEAGVCHETLAPPGFYVGEARKFAIVGQRYDRLTGEYLPGDILRSTLGKTKFAFLGGFFYFIADRFCVAEMAFVSHKYLDFHLLSCLTAVVGPDT